MTADPRRPATLQFTDEARADLYRHRALFNRFMRALGTLRTRPDRGHLLTGDPLGGCRSLELTHAGGGFRAVYLWNQGKGYVVVFAIGPHDEAYALAAKRFPPPEPEP